MARRRKGGPISGPDARLPDAFVERSAATLGDEWPTLREALDARPPVSIRINSAKPGGPSGEAVPWCSTGRYLPERPTFTLDPLLHAGAYYVQEASSMFLEQALRASGLLDKPILALDLCAAPGGKSTLVRGLLHPDSLLVANEVDRRRQHALQENLWKWGLPNVVVTGSDPADLVPLSETFHLIVVDAPCSGEGMFRKDPYARQQWSEGLVQRCAMVQAHIVEQAWNTLRPGGILIYSTCTWEASENEDRLRQLKALGAVPMPIPLEPLWGIVETKDQDVVGYRCYPHRLRGEGFFIGMVRKPGDLGTDPRSAQPDTDHPEVRAWSHQGAHWHLREQDDVLHAVDVRWAASLDTLCPVLRTLAPGRPVAERKAGTWRPHPALALDTSLDRSAFTEIELDHTEALDYLRGQALPGHSANGPGLVVHKGLPLGWANGAGSRWNNLWPAPWRIRMHGS